MPDALSDVVVVGGGIAGLTAAAFAARAGAKVMLLEGGLELGGRARTREERGFRFNFGPHALYLGGAAMRTLGELGLDPAGAPPPQTSSFFVRDGKLFRMPRGAADIATTNLMSLGDRRALARAFGAMMKGFRGEVGETVVAALRRLTPNAKARAVIEAQIRVATYSNASDLADAAAIFDQLRLGFHGVRYLDGGWAAMIASLAEAAREAGAIIRTQARVDAVSQTADGWRILCANGETVDAAAVILALAPDEAAALAPDIATLRHAASRAVAVRAASLDVALSKLPRETHTFALGLDAPIYFSVHSVAAKGLAPEGGALIHVSYYLAPEEKPSAAIRTRLEALLDLMQPGWRDVRVAEQWLPLTAVTHDMPQAAHRGLSGRAAIAAAPGLYVAGDWVGGEAMLSDAAFASGRAAGQAAAAHLGAGVQRVA